MTKITRSVFAITIFAIAIYALFISELIRTKNCKETIHK